MLQDNFRNLNRVIFIQRKHLKSQVNAFWYCFKVIKRYTFHYLIKSVLILGNQSSFEILQLFVTWQVSPHYFLVLLWLWSKMNQMVFIFFSGTIQVLEERDLQLTRLSSIISPNLWNLIDRINHFCIKNVITFSLFSLLKTTYVYSLFIAKDRVIKVNSISEDDSMNL